MIVLVFFGLQKREKSFPLSKVLGGKRERAASGRDFSAIHPHGPGKTQIGGSGAEAAVLSPFPWSVAPLLFCCLHGTLCLLLSCSPIRLPFPSKNQVRRTRRWPWHGKEEIVTLPVAAVAQPKQGFFVHSGNLCRHLIGGNLSKSRELEEGSHSKASA